MVSLDKITTKGKALYLAYDQGMEHGPSDFDDESIDPGHILKVGVYGGYNGVIVQKGIAEKYYNASPFKDALAKKLPLILKLNGKTNLHPDEEPYSPLLCTIEEALALGASAVGYTVYVGSEHEAKMTAEFAQVVRDAHAKHLPVIGWMYPRGKALRQAQGKRTEREILVYAARMGLELGADMIKIPDPEDQATLKWAVEAAGRTKVIVSGGKKEDEDSFLARAKQVMESGAIGMAVGRNIWQAKDPLALTKKLKAVIFSS